MGNSSIINKFKIYSKNWRKLITDTITFTECNDNVDGNISIK